MLLSNDASHSLAIICRKDLSLSKGKFASQCAHAAVQCALHSQKSAKSDYEKWRNTGSRKVVLYAEDVDQLQELQQLAEQKNIVSALVKDAGRTEIPPGMITVLGLGPAMKTQIDDLCSGLELVR